MSEKLGTNKEYIKEADSGIESLAEEAGKFDPDKAMRLQELGKSEKKVKEERFLQALPEKKKELSPKDAADEYLSLLDELSKDFSNPYYGDERKGDSHYASNITTNLGRKYSENPHYRWKGYASTEAGEADGTMLRIASADNILANEIGWREDGEKVGKKIKEIDDNISDLKDDYAKKGKIGKFSGKRKYEKALKALESSKHSEEYKFGKYNSAIADELAISYNEKGNYRGDYSEAAYRNEERNRRFFGFDDPERAAKIERAIELRKKYENEWSKK